jgi:dipeptidase E
MGKFVAIGGVTPPSSLDLIDEEIIKLTNKKYPKVLYIPTAGGDNLNYCKFYKEIYEGKFGCKLDVLFLIKERPTENKIREKIFSSDIIYIGGGSVSRLIEYFIKFNLNNILKEAYDNGIVLAGISAGAICFGKHYFETEGVSDYKKVDCLSFYEFLICPHYNLDGYSEKLDYMIKEYELVGIALDNDCAIEFVGNTYRVIATKDNAYAYKVIKKGTKIIKEIILKDSIFRSMDELVEK